MIERRLLLASTSDYRRELLQRLGIPFESVAPGVDEAPLEGEAPDVLVGRLARAKAAAVGRAFPDACVIGSDQLATLGDRLLGKPGGLEAAGRQLAAMSGRDVVFLTSVCAVSQGREVGRHVDRTTVRFRDLSAAEIDRYVEAERPFDCAGSFKSEGLGITLFESIGSDDPTALIGLPLIATARLLRQAGFALP